MSRHAGHETNSARPRVSSPSRRRRASQGTTSDAVANRTIQATIPRRDPDTISGGEAARGVMTVPIEVPSRRRSAAGIESGGEYLHRWSGCRLPDFKRASHDGRDGELEGVHRLVGGRRRGLRRGVRASSRPRHVRARRGARRGVDGGAPSPLQRIFLPQPHPRSRTTTTQSPSPSPRPLPQIEFASVHLPRMCEAFDRASAADLPADHRDQSWSWVDDAVPAVVSVSRHPVVPRRRPNPNPRPRSPTRPIPNPGF